MSVIAWSVRMYLYQFINRDKTTYQGQLDEQGIFICDANSDTRDLQGRVFTDFLSKFLSFQIRISVSFEQGTKRLPK